MVAICGTPRLRMANGSSNAVPEDRDAPVSDPMTIPRIIPNMMHSMTMIDGPSSWDADDLGWQHLPGLPPQPMSSAQLDSPPFLRSWWTRDSAGVSDAMRTALDHQIRLDNAIEELKQIEHTRSKDLAISPVHLRIFESIESSLEGLRNFISSMRHPHFFNERSSTNWQHRVAQKVSEIPELLEKILLDTDMRDIIHMRQQSRTIQANNEGSPKLQRPLFILPQPFSSLQLPPLFDNNPFFAIGVARKYKFVLGQLLLPFDNRRSPTCTLNAKFFTISQRKLCPAGKSLQATLLCQPPIKEMEYRFKCCGAQPGHVRTGAIKASGGITLGHLYTKTKEIIEAHALCPDAPASYLDQKGFVRLEVFFSGELQLLEGDPIRHSSSISRFIRPVGAAQVNGPVDKRLKDYAKVKTLVFARGNVIPTLEEYEALQRS